MLTGKIEQFTSFSNFSTLKDFNNNIEQWMIDVKSNFTAKELVCLKRLIRYSSKVFGVSNISINSLLKAIKQHDNVTVSAATFHRMKRKAITVGLLSVYETKRTDNSQSSNVWVFNAYSSTVKVDNDTPIKSQESSQTAPNQQSENKLLTSLKASKNIKTNNINNKDYRNTRTHKQTHFDYSFVCTNTVNPNFIDAVKLFYNNADDIYALHNRLTLAVRNNACMSLLDTHIDDFINVFRNCVYQQKRNKIKGDLFGYIYGAWARTASRIQRYINATSGDYYDWLAG